MKTDETQEFSEFLGEVPNPTLIIFSNDCVQMEKAISHKHLKVMTCFGLDLIHADRGTLESIRFQLENEDHPQIILVNHYPSRIHQMLLNDFDKQARWKKQAESIRNNYLKLKKEGVQRISDRDFAVAYLSQQVIFLHLYLKNQPSINHDTLRIKGMLLEEHTKISEPKQIFFHFIQN